MIDQIDASSKSALAQELIKRNLMNQKPSKIKVKMVFKPKGNSTTINPDSNQWQG